MMKKLLKNGFLILILMSLSVLYTNAQTLTYDFETDWDGWNAGAASGPWSSSFANSPNGILEMTYAADSKNAIMYAPDENGDTTYGEIDASTYRHFKIIYSNESTDIDLLRIRIGTDNGAGGHNWINAHDLAITTHAVDEFSTQTFEITNANYTGNVRFQVIFRNSGSAVLDDGSKVRIDQIQLSANTLSSKSFNKAKINIYVANNILNAPKAADYQIYSITGAKVLEGKAVKSIDISSLASGLYIYKTLEGFAKFVR
ncbi:T9SS type A sorting domain-containing protein [Tamlana fucoidanivorans]|uniref:T9SS type A sorting domain-containing protein n=1 Tax=Allotamlana fucoidanivorans TaxID=2583814 RepID=A0A5C4SQ32_9FLAO|nr:T9SS type A sorting domain-containing protein [Tamlana fucoidanivorans]TNJ46372.1 T9SS type A sorting domain-containing protein [Tamlana fucoidanivorans]